MKPNKLTAFLLLSSSAINAEPTKSPLDLHIPQTEAIVHHDWFSTYLPVLLNPSKLQEPHTTLKSRAHVPKAKQSAAHKRLKIRVRYAHGILMGLAFLGFYPFAAILLRVARFRYVVWVHAGIQVFGLLVMYAGLGSGVWFAREDESLYNSKHLYLKAHTYIGTIVPALMILQPFFGFLHHKGFLKSGARTVFSFIHIYFGRILILAGAINGIVGRENEGVDYAHGRSIWSALFGVVLAIYVIVLGVTAFTRRRKSPTVDSSASSSRIDTEKDVQLAAKPLDA